MFCILHPATISRPAAVLLPAAEVPPPLLLGGRMVVAPPPAVGCCLRGGCRSSCRRCHPGGAPHGCPMSLSPWVACRCAATLEGRLPHPTAEDPASSLQHCAKGLTERCDTFAQYALHCCSMTTLRCLAGTVAKVQETEDLIMGYAQRTEMCPYAGAPCSRP